MRLLLSLSIHIWCFIKRCWLALYSRPVRIIYFHKDRPVSVNDLPIIISWKVGNAWKVELVGMADLPPKGVMILNNYNEHRQLVLKAYGRKGKIVAQSLDLNHSKAPMQPMLAEVINNAESLPVAPGSDEWDHSMEQLHNSMVHLSRLLSKSEAGRPGFSECDLIPVMEKNGFDLRAKLNLLEESQLVYFEKEMQLKNPENFTSTNLFQ